LSNGIASGWEAYQAHYGIAPEDSAGGGFAQAPPRGGLIYERKEEEDAVSRLERVLGGSVGVGQEDVAAPGEGELTEAQKIFGTDKTFTKSLVHRGVLEAAAKAAGRDLAEEEAEAAAVSAGVGNHRPVMVPHPTDIRRLGPEVAQRHVEMMAMAQPPPGGGGGAGSYAQSATFNKRTGRFEGQGQVVRMSVTDSRRQTSHYFDYDKWAHEKGQAPKPPAKKPKKGVGL